jgi:dTDP-4-dehydrorhamnose reductase
MKVLLTGARGQLATEVARGWAGRAEVVALDAAALDVTRLGDVRAQVRSIGPAAVVNCAAYNAVDRAEDDFAAACLVNGIGPRNLAIAAEEQGVPLVHFGTDYVFDGEKDTPYTIADAPRPLSRYGESKLLGESMVRTLCRRHLVIRLSWVFGAGGDSFPRKLVAWSAGKRQLRVVTDQVSCPTYTVDAAELIWKLRDAGAYGLYHLSNTGVCSRFEWARFIAARVGLEVEVLPATERDFPTPARRPRYSALDPFPLLETVGALAPPWQEATERFLSEQGAVRR